MYNKDGIIRNRVVNIDKFIEYNNPSKIYLDVDGVIFHSCQAVCDVYNRALNNKTGINGNEILSWNFKELNENMTDENIEFLFSNQAFFEMVSWIKGAFDFVEKYRNKIIVVTKGTNDNIYYKRELFDLLGFNNIPIYGLPLCCSKDIVDMSNNGLFIDDCTKNLNESNATYKIQFLEYNDNMNEKREWIKDWNGLKMYKW